MKLLPEKKIIKGEAIVKNLFKKIENENINVITIYDDNYPKGLKYIDDNPKILFETYRSQ